MHGLCNACSPYALPRKAFRTQLGKLCGNACALDGKIYFAAVERGSHRTFGGPLEGKIKGAMSEQKGAKPSTGRIAYFDNAKGLLIFLVVLGHLISYMAANDSHLLFSVNAWIYSFHMPMFIFISGIFSSKAYTKEKGFRGENVIFYMALCLIFRLLAHFIDLAFGLDVSFNFFKQGSAPWYLFVMAIYTLCTPLFARVKPSVMLSLLIIASIASGFWITYDTRALFACGKLFSYAPIFAAGYYIGIGKAGEFHDKVFALKHVNLLRVLAVLAFFGAIAAFYLLPDSYASAIRKMSTGWNEFDVMGKALHGSAAAFIVARLLVYVQTAVWALIFLLGIPQRRSFLTTWGERSLQVYILHMLVIYSLDRIAFNDMMLAYTHWWLLSPFIVAIILTAILAAPKFLQTWTNALKSLCKKAVRKQS